MDCARYTSTSLLTRKKLSASLLTRRFANRFCFTRFYVDERAVVLCLDRLPSSLQCSRDTHRSRITAVYSLVRRRKSTSERLCHPPLRSSHPRSPRQTLPSALQPTDPRPPRPARRIHNRAPQPHALRARVPLACRGDPTHQRALVAPHGLHRRRGPACRIRVLPRGRLSGNVRQRVDALRRRVPVRVWHGGRD